MAYPSVLFDNKIRSDTDSIRARESTYKFLDRVERDRAGERRDNANELYARYPECLAKQNLWSQISSKTSETAFDNFFFELWVHAYLKDHGVEILEIEPALANVATKPDFLCRANGCTFYVEAVTVNHEPFSHRQLALLDTDLRFLANNGWFCTLTVELSSEAIPLPNDVRKELSLVLKRNPSLAMDGPPLTHLIVRPGWRLEFSLFRSSKKRQHFVSATAYGFRVVELRPRIESSVRDKARKYGKLPIPLIIAVNLQGSNFSRLEHGLDAMYGDAQVRMGLEELSGQAHWNPKSNGICQLSSCSGHLDSVLFFEGAGAWSLRQPPHVLIRNPQSLMAPVLALESAPRIVVNKLNGCIEAKNSFDFPLDADQRWFHELTQK